MDSIADKEKCLEAMEEAKEIELLREHYLKEYEDNTGDITTEIDHSPGSLAFHEAFNTSWVVYSMFEAHILSDPAVFKDSELFAEAHKASRALWDLYQTMGVKHL
jgi:hypothetical protein